MTIESTGMDEISGFEPYKDERPAVAKSLIN